MGNNDVPPDWMILEAITKLSRKHNGKPSEMVIQNYLIDKYQYYRISILKDKLEVMRNGGILARFPGNYYKSPQWAIHPDYYPEPPLKDPWTEEQREALREELRKMEDRKRNEIEYRKEYQRRKSKERTRLKHRAKLRPSPKVLESMERDKVWIESPEVMEILEEDPGSVLIIDTETTGLSARKDDVLELSIINGAGITIFSERFNSWLDSWGEAREIHGIKPEDVRGLPYFEEKAGEVSRILRNAKVIVGYNVGFDLWFLRYSGVKIPLEIPKCDIMEEFSYVYGEWADWVNGGYGGYKWQKLWVAGKYYKIDTEGAHWSLADCRITLGVMKGIAKEPERKRHRPDPREEPREEPQEDW